MALLKEITDWIAGGASCGTPGVDLFGGPMPDNGINDLCTQVMEYGGLPSDVSFGVVGIYREHPRVQILTRSNVRDSASGKARIVAIKNRIAAIPWPTTIDGTAYHIIRLLQPPFWVRSDAKWRDYYEFNVEFTKDPE